MQLFVTVSPAHAVFTREKPKGQVQLLPTFNRPDGQPQSVLFSSFTWFPGHREIGLELGENVVNEAVGVKTKKMQFLGKLTGKTEEKNHRNH